MRHRIAPLARQAHRLSDLSLRAMRIQNHALEPSKSEQSISIRTCCIIADISKIGAERMEFQCTENRDHTNPCKRFHDKSNNQNTRNTDLNMTAPAPHLPQLYYDCGRYY